MDKYFTSARLLTHLAVNSTLRTELDQANALLLEEIPAKKERSHFKQYTSSQRQCNFDSGWLEQQQVT